jgi:hypothetical protein
MPGFVYILCTITSLLSGTLMIRGARKHGNRMLFWSSLCFFAMAANNVLLYANFIIFPNVDLLTVARLVTLIGILFVNYGLIWHTV